MSVRSEDRIRIEPTGIRLAAGTLKVPMIRQEQTNWCWAACTDMVLDYYGNPNARQCDFANWLFQLADCCSVSSEACNQPCQGRDVSRIYSNWGIQSSYQNSAVPFSTIESEIAASRPVEVGFRWNGGRGGHVVLVVETSVINNQESVRVNDPDIGNGGVLYSELLTAYGRGTWIDTWTGIMR